MELQLEGLSKTYGTVQALRKVTYTFKPGIYGILGANGAGKSTMINLITDNVSRDSGSDGGKILYMAEGAAAPAAGAAIAAAETPNSSSRAWTSSESSRTVRPLISSIIAVTFSLIVMILLI